MSAAGLLAADTVSVVLDGATLLHPTSAGLSAGECVALRGENGAGKTTLLRVLAGRPTPTSGAARLHGRPLDERDPRAREPCCVGAVTEPGSGRPRTGRISR